MDSARRNELRLAMQELIERIDLDPATRTARLHHVTAAGDAMATPRGFEPLLQP